MIIGYVVTGPKTLKYAHFDVTVLNRVGDPATCNVRRSASQTLVCTGPVQAGIWQAFNQFSVSCTTIPLPLPESIKPTCSTWMVPRK